MADLAAALDALATGARNPGPPCGVRLYLERLAERDAVLHARVVGLIDSEAVRASDLATALAVDGATFSPYALRHHRRRATPGGCRCPR